MLKKMWKKLTKGFRSHKARQTEHVFDRLMRDVERDNRDLEQLEGMIHREFDVIQGEVARICETVDRVVDGK